ncbi:LysR family transcriptional regulator [Maliponia aquimaris]|uniref:Putative hydrogen peroxide-inducible genes activator n=1 Tax=Maliponia aquimaris TaxID=1673631 RepID=A0A238KGG7_9RHOB|nr:LysR family transcriptional regulator [Maliponia aquimaris]SMX41860.1 putative hydrogen peroxide-inducible genes activator [Maliponia aquimaris]
MAQITLKQLEAFVQVADLASFRRAAERLNTTQPNVSARISAVESQLGLRLFDRDAGSVRLTPAGRPLLAKARAVLAAVDGFVAAAGEDQLFEGILRLGVTEMIVHSWLGAFLRALKARFPGIDVELTVDLSANLSPQLFSRALDLTLQSGPFGRQITGGEDLGAFPLVWVAAPRLGLHGPPLSLREVAAHPVLTHARGTLPFEQLRDHVASHPDVSVRLVPSTNLAACLQMTLDGLGVACLPEVMLRAPLAEGRLMPLRYLWVPDPLRFRARYDSETAPSYVVRAAELARDVARDSLDPARG